MRVPPRRPEVPFVPMGRRLHRVGWALTGACAVVGNAAVALEACGSSPAKGPSAAAPPDASGGAQVEAGLSPGDGAVMAADARTEEDGAALDGEAMQDGGFGSVDGGRDYSTDRSL